MHGHWRHTSGAAGRRRPAGAPCSPGAETQTTATNALAELIAQYLAEYRDALSEVDELAVPTPPASKVWNQHNTGTGTFIGGDVQGDVIFNYGGAPDGGR